MINNLLKQHRPDVYEFAQNNKYTKPLMKQLDVIWKKIDTYLQKEMKKQLGKQERLCRQRKKQKVF